MAISPNVPGDDEIPLSVARDRSKALCTTDLKNWMERDQLKLNNDKTEFL